MTEGTKEVLDNLIRLAVDFLEAEDGVIYGEVEKDKFVPITSFSVRREIPEVCFFVGGENRENLLSFVISSWPEIFVTSDSSLIESLGVPYRDKPPRSFMAIPFKVGSRRFLLAFSSDRLDVFPERSQKILIALVKFLKTILVRFVEVEFSYVVRSKFNMLKDMLDRVVEESDPSLVLYSVGEFLELDFIGFFYKEGDDIVSIALHTFGGLNANDIKVIPRSIVYLAFDRNEPYVVLDEEEFLPGLKGYGFIIPYRGVTRRYVFVVLSKKENYLTEDLFDVFDIFGRIFVRMIEATDEKSELVSPTESFLNRLRIISNRVSRENLKLLLILIEIKEFVKDVSRKGFWETDRTYWEVFYSLKEKFPKFYMYKIKDNFMAMLSMFESRDMAKEASKAVREFMNSVDVVNIYNTHTFIMPDEVSSVDNLLYKLDHILRDEDKKIQKKRFFI
ncbi:MAG: GAF domain-containing protein [Thermosulfidibacteraceae bacterium]|jgi:hypothetical protein